MINDIIKQDEEQFSSICAKHQINNLFAFGSSITKDFKPDSDIDLLVEIKEDDPLVKGELLFSLWDNLELFFHRRVDLVTDSSIHNPVLLKNIEATKKLIYDGAKGKIVN